ncbi:zinc transporter ZIP1-like [Metopolophium dirhodum]|uniref:zinc transporter ZIP1-like n=1 Tax=Metopolophium dirhodum TaxID=44670 RepID=UPI00298FC206|nr:zinc transporter ZIP1-like [Metopolophium dirhodum]
MDSSVAMNSISTTDRIAAAKASVSLLLCLCSFATGLSPIKFAHGWRASRARISRKPTIASVLLCFGGGVLLFTALIRMQPDVRRSVHVLQVAGRLPDTDHLGDLVFCAGLFAVFVIDEVVNLTRGPGRRTGTIAATGVRPSPKSFRVLFAVVALSFQEAFVGLSFGMETAGPDDGVWYAYATASATKLIVAFCLGMELAWSGARNSAIVACSAVFATVTPVGVAIGMALSQCCDNAAAYKPPSPGILHVISQGLGAGSLAFVVFLEVFPRHKHAGFTHLLSAIVGFYVMLCLQFATDYQQSA